jgi:uncharacterized damage-inducible protein DinB
MMTKTDRLIDELTRALDNEPWYGPSIHDVVGGLSAADASVHPVPGAHSIWEILHHMTAWVRAVHVRVGGDVCELEGQADWPPVRDTSQKAWAAALDDLRGAQSQLIAKQRTLRDAELNAITPNRDYDIEHLLRGLIQHHAYHTGQMSLLKTACRARGQGLAARGGS